MTFDQELRPFSWYYQEEPLEYGEVYQCDDVAKTWKHGYTKGKMARTFGGIVYGRPRQHVLAEGWGRCFITLRGKCRFEYVRLLQPLTFEEMSKYCS